MKESKTERLRDELAYYKQIHLTPLSKFFPELLEYDVEDGFWFKLKYYPYENLGTLLLNSNGAYDWEEIISQLTVIIAEFRSVSDSFICPLRLYNKEMYIDKTYSEYCNLIRLWELSFPHLMDSLISPEYITLNGQRYQNFHRIWDTVKTKLEKITYIPSIIHGDMCFSNILFNEVDNTFKLVDPRGSFGLKGVFGDTNYDYAKILHSIDGLYESIIYDDFELSSGFNLKFKTINEVKRDALLAIVHTLFPLASLDTVKTIEGTLFIGMCARHYDNIQRQIAMYLTGVRILNEVLT